ncbi:unnamed protein product [Rangifer tarandus platyrhynchus]|uniref:Uncharacterized protein n=2 Tax=Rangifer tarandus platyrhynchus TaxID=3082113 RepID=A0ABN9A7E9_RANTA|nr:unnamed protein product [Rangifer tarandus platyrhynchus]CAI9714270.1 unnamed protein product [Rangifer tarandus platyrhynchus]
MEMKGFLWERAVPRSQTTLEAGRLPSCQGRSWQPGRVTGSLTGQPAWGKESQGAQTSRHSSVSAELRPERCPGLLSPSLGHFGESSCLARPKGTD